MSHERFAWESEKPYRDFGAMLPSRQGFSKRFELLHGSFGLRLVHHGENHGVVSWEPERLKGIARLTHSQYPGSFRERLVIDFLAAVPEDHVPTSAEK